MNFVFKKIYHNYFPTSCPQGNENRDEKIRICIGNRYKYFETDMLTFLIPRISNVLEEKVKKESRASDDAGFGG